MPTAASDIAIACHYLLQFRLIDHLAIRQWGDQLIAAAEAPPDWMIDLADCHFRDVDERVRRVPGKPSLDVWPNILCGLLYIRWHQNKLTIATMHSLGWMLYRHFAGAHAFLWGVELDYANDLFQGGVRTADDLAAAASSIIATFEGFEAFVPDWMR